MEGKANIEENPTPYADTVRPVSWASCPFCHARAHAPCATRSGRRYPMGEYHRSRIDQWYAKGPKTPPAHPDGRADA